MHLRFLAFLVLLGLSQCNKTQPPSATDSSSGLNLVTEGGSPHFHAVAAKLEVGGASFTYAEEEDVIGLLGTIVENVIKRMPEEEKAKMPPNFSFKKVMDLIGLSSIKASGTSSRKGKAGLNHHRSFVYTPFGRKGLLSLTGGPAEPLLVPALAPPDTDLAFEFPLHLKDWVTEAWPVLIEYAPKEERAMIEAMASAPQPMLGMSYREMAEKLSVRIGFMATLMPEQSISAPGAPVSFPGVNAAIVIDKLGWIKEVLKKQVLPMFHGDTSPVELLTVDGKLVGRFRGPMGPPPMDFQPTFQFDEIGDRLIIATRPGYFEALMSTTGKLNANPDFASAWKGLPSEGNGCLIVSKRLMTTLIDGVKTSVASSGMDADNGEMVAELIGLLEKHAKYPQAVCYANVPNGILTAANTSVPTLNPGSFSSLSTLAVLSSLTVPMTTSIQQQATQMKVLSDGRQVLTALKMFASGNGGKYPAKLQELVESGALPNEELVTVAASSGGERLPWLYNATLTPESPGITIVLASPSTVKSGAKETRAVIRNDGRAEMLAEEDFQRSKDFHLK